MGEKIIVGPGINKALRNDTTAFNIDNDSFPTLTNAYQWRGRVKRKRGTTLLNRLARGFFSTTTAYNSGSTTITLNGSGEGNLFTGFGLETNANLIPQQIAITDTVSLVVYTDPSGTGTLSPSGTINYATGDVTIAAASGNPITATFAYNPDLPVLGLEDVILPNFQFPRTMGFDTTYAYDISTIFPYPIHDVSWYKNPAADGINLPGYVPKTTWTPTFWNGADYRQFWSTNYQGAFWVTNGVEVPFTGTTLGMQFAPSSTITFNAVTPTTITLIITNCPLVIGDFVFLNEWTSGTAGASDTLNFQSGYVTACAPNTPALAVKTVTITLPFATITAAAYAPGIVQYLTTRVNTSIDCIRWYDGDPTNGVNANTFVQGGGWVNFCPPLSQFNYSIAGVPAAQYYLVGAKLIVPFKDRLLFLGPVIQTSSGNPIYLHDTIIYSQNGTPYYTASFTGNPLLPTTQFHPILTPTNETATASAWWEDQTGFGGFISTGLMKPITTVGYNEDVLIIDIGNSKARVVYTGNDIVPFNIFIINSELGDGSTFTAITLDQGVMTQGSKGYIICNQTSAQRIDLEIPDQVFQVNLINNGVQRATAQRDFINEWVYFSYSSNEFSYVYPTQTLMYNYRDHSWGIFNESYTHYGQFRPSTGLTWLTIEFSWQNWNSSWTAGDNNLEQPQVIAGNQQGFLVFRENEDINESNSLFITSFSGSIVTSPNHCLNNGDYIVISGSIGTISTEVNDKIFSVSNATTNTFQVNPGINSGTYFGGGLIKRMYIPFIATKQFPPAWGLARKTRLGPQQYLLTKTPNGQIQLLIYLSTDDSIAYNNLNDIINSGLVYSTILYTCRESNNLGLTAANTNLQMLTQIGTGPTSSNSQLQIWHRMNTSLIGDTIQVAFTLSDTQMRDEDFSSQFQEIELHSFILDINPGPLLA